MEEEAASWSLPLSRLALQRVMVRMLFDSEYTNRVLREPGVTLSAETLTGEEIAWLLRPDPRAWKTDPDRPLRSLGVLAQEYPTACALAGTSPGGVEALRSFFSSELFHGVVQRRGSMALAFGEFLLHLVSVGVAPNDGIAALARLETAIARLLRRISGEPATMPAHFPANESSALEGRPGEFRLSDDKALHLAASGSADLRDEVLGLLVDPRKGRGSFLEPMRSLPRTKIGSERSEPLLLELVRIDGPRMKWPVGVAEITRELFEILSFASVPRPRPEIEAEAVRLGAEAEEAPEIVGGLVEEGVLIGMVEVPTPPSERF